MMSIKRTIAVIFTLAAMAQPASAAEVDFYPWLAGIRQEAIQKGVSKETVASTLNKINYLPRVIELDRKQPESRLTFPEYKKKTVNPARIKEGRALFRQYSQALDTASRNSCGIAPEIIVALWGMETNFGDATGGFNVLEALATLAFDGRRSAFFKDELFSALKIIDEGHISPDKMTGSWAGAMGQNQFMPSSFIRYAVDGNGDGKRDIWNSLPDIFASTANYLCQNGWKAGERWGREVKLSQAVPKSLTGLDIKKSMPEWSGMGITLPDGSPLPQEPGRKASLVIPDGSTGGFLVYDNYRVVMKWNRSVYFATSVAMLADSIAVNE